MAEDKDLAPSEEKDNEDDKKTTKQSPPGQTFKSRGIEKKG